MKSTIHITLDDEQMNSIKKQVLEMVKEAFEYDTKVVLYKTCDEIRRIYRELIGERSMELEKDGLHAEEYHVRRYCQGEDYAYLDSISILANALCKLQNDDEIVKRIFGTETFYSRLEKAFNSEEE